MVFSFDVFFKKRKLGVKGVFIKCIVFILCWGCGVELKPSEGFGTFGSLNRY